MTFGFGFILLLLVLGGFAAYQGDRVGMAVGRKRLSIFGLRPKYTSRVVAILTGIVIVTLTMSSLLLISHSARQSLFGLEELQATIARLSHQITSLEDLQYRLDQENSTLQAQNEALHAETDALIARNEELAAVRAELEQANEALRAEQAFLQERFTSLRGLSGLVWQNLLHAHLVYQANDVIATYVVQVPETRDGLIDEVLQVLSAANRKVLQDGAGDPVTGRGISLERSFFNEDGALILLTEESHLEQLVDSLWYTPNLDSAVIQVVALSNAFQGLPVELDFRLVVNQRVFRAGEVVAERTFDGRRSGPDLFADVWAWLETDVRGAALARGLLAQPDGKVTAEVSPATLYKVVESILTAGGPTQVNAVAATDVWTSQELSLDFLLAEP